MFVQPAEQESIAEKDNKDNDTDRYVLEVLCVRLHQCAHTQISRLRPAGARSQASAPNGPSE